MKDLALILNYFNIVGNLKSEKNKGSMLYHLNIPSKYAKDYQTNIGSLLHSEKLENLVKFIDRNDVKFLSEQIDKINGMGEIIAYCGKTLKIDGQSRIYGFWKNKETIGRRTLEKYYNTFNTHPNKELVANELLLIKQAVNANVMWDEIINIEYYTPSQQEFVYDFTVPGNDSFMVDQNVLVHNTLNTFHQAGVASKSAVTRGVPRLRELLKVTQNPKATSLTIYLKPEFRNNKEKAREVIHDLELTLLKHITDKVGIYWESSKEQMTVIPEDVDLMAFYRSFEKGIMMDSDEEPWSKWVLRLELNREEMFNRNISIQEIVSVMKVQFEQEIHIVYSDYNSSKLVMRIRLLDTPDEKDTASQLDHFTRLKKFQNKLLNSIVIRGLPGIKAVAFRNDKQQVEMREQKYEQIEQFVLDTDGSNFIKVMNHPAIDGNKLYSTNVWDVYEMLGIEATRAVLMNEINGLFDSVGVNYRHLCLLCDVMTRFGKLMSIDRYGINKNDIGTLAKASFEETEKILLKAALFGEVDPVTGVSANIMMGQPIRGGTAFSEILLDDQMMAKLLETVQIHEEEEEEFTELPVETELDLNKACSNTRFKMNMLMPSVKSIIDEPDIELDVVYEEEEEE